MPSAGTSLARSNSKRETRTAKATRWVISLVGFHARAVEEVYARSKWRGLMSAAHKTTKIVWGVAVSAGGFGLLALYFTYIWPLLGKRWWAIIYLSVLVVVLLVLNGIVKTFHEQTIKDAEGKLRAAQLQKIEDGKALSFQRDQTEIARQWQSELRSKLAFWDAISARDRCEIEHMIRTYRPEIYEYDIYSDTPSIEFWFFVFNGSLYSISIDPEINGFIEYNRRRLRGEITTARPWINEILRGGDAGIRLRLWLEPDEVEALRKLDKAQRPRFNVRNLIVTVRGGQLHPEVEPRPLVLNFSEIAARRNDRQP